MFHRIARVIEKTFLLRNLLRNLKVLERILHKLYGLRVVVQQLLKKYSCVASVLAPNVASPYFASTHLNTSPGNDDLADSLIVSVDRY